MKQTLSRIISWALALTVPIVLAMTILRVLFSPLFIYPQVEYRMPYFPADTYGFTREDRLHWSRISIEYLFNDAGIEFLGDQRLPDGAPLYNERELSHMVDVKVLAQKAFQLGAILLGIWVVLGLWAWRGRWLPTFLRGLGNGGRLTIALVLLVLVGVAISFNGLFTVFHELFFTGDTWIFLYSDTLIRLFPLPFWRDLFILVGVLILLGGVLLIWVEKRMIPPPKSTASGGL